MADLIAMLSAAASVDGGAAADPFFNQTTLLLHGDGTNGAQNNTFLDGSTNTFTITRNGNTTQGTFSPFSNADGEFSNFFDGSGDYLTFGDNLDIVANNFTFECFVYFSSINNTYNAIFSKYGASYSYQFLWDAPNNRWFWNVNNGASTTVTFSDTIVANQWYYLCLERTGTSYKLYRDGSQIGTTQTISGDIADGTRPFALGTTFNGSDGALYPFVGYISNFRAVIGSNVYGSAPSIPTAPLTNITDTQLLTCQSNRFVDNSGTPKTITVNGNPSIQPFSPFAPTAAYSPSVNGGSGYFDGSGDYITAPDDADFDFGIGDFTISAWVYPQGSGGIIDQGGGGASTNRSFEIYMSNSSTISNAYISSDGTYQAAYNLTGTTQPNAWNFIEFTRTGGNIYLFVNGAQQSTTSANITIYNSTATVAVGNTSASTVNPFTGYISNVRVVKGSGSSSSTVPTAPLTAVSGTSLLLNFTNAGIFDNTGKNNLETVADAQIDTSVKKYGTGSMEFDGTGDWLKGITNENTKFGTGDYTIEMWIYPTTSNTCCLFDSRSANPATDGLAIFQDNTGLDVFSDAYDINTTGVLTLNQWQHIAVVRSSGTLTAYVNGSSVGTTSNTDNHTAGRISIGANVSNTNPYTGYIDDFRITKGVARYTAAFTPPTAAFPDL